MKFLRLIILVAGIIILKSCVNHDIGDPSLEPTTDASLFDEANSTGFTFYQNGAIIQQVSPSTHGQFKLRFNAIAASVLDNTGELPANGRFPVGSIIVKESYRNNTLSALDVIKKSPTDVNASNGWLWGVYALDGVAAVTIENKGSQCVNCHSGTPNRDLVRTFDLH